MKRSICAMGIAALALSHGVAAKPLKLLGTQLDLPFYYTVTHQTQGADSNYGLRSYQTEELQISSGDAKGQRIFISSDYYSPSRTEAGVVQNWGRGEAEKAAALAGNRSVQPVQIDGFGFNFIDGPVDSKDYPQRMGVDGAINGAVYRVSVFAKDAGPLSATLADRLKALHLDYPDLLKGRARFDAESSAATGSGCVETPLGRLQLGSDVSTTFIGSLVKRDGTGQPIERLRTFGMHKAGFWTIQNLVLYVSCGKFDEKEYNDYIRMSTSQSDPDAKTRFTDISAPQPAVLAGVAGQTVSAAGQLSSGARHSTVTRWVSRQGDTMFLAQIERLNGSPIENAINRQLAGAAPVCRLDLPYGNAGAVALPPPPAPPAPPAAKPAA